MPDEDDVINPDNLEDVEEIGEKPEEEIPIDEDEEEDVDDDEEEEEEEEEDFE